jgi:hypothetical protein
VAHASNFSFYKSFLLYSMCAYILGAVDEIDAKHTNDGHGIFFW